MSPQVRIYTPTRTRAPRVSGDEPKVIEFDSYAAECSPRERG